MTVVAGQRRRYGDRENLGLKGAALDSSPKGPRRTLPARRSRIS
jgi:hypothetical protein